MKQISNISYMAYTYAAIFGGSVMNKKVNIFELSLVTLVFINELSKIYLFSQLEVFPTLVKVIEWIIYLGLLCVILQKKVKAKELIIIALLAAMLLIGYLQSGMAVFFRGLLLIVAAKGIPYKRIVHICRIAMCSSFVLALLMFFVGISNSGVARRGYYALGYIHPNIAAQVMFIICLLWLAEIGSHASIKHYILCEIYGLAIFLTTGSRTPSILIMIAPIMIEIIKQLMIKNAIGKNLSTLLKLSQVIILIFSYVTAVILPYNELVNRLDLFFSNRIFLNYYSLAKYGLKLFGQNVVLQDNSGTVYNNIRNMYNWNVTVDNSYIVSLIIMGIIPTIIFVCGYILIINKGIKNRNYMVCGIAVLIAIYSFSESQMLEIYNNFVYFYIFASCSVNDTMPKGFINSVLKEG